MQTRHPSAKEADIQGTIAKYVATCSMVNNYLFTAACGRYFQSLYEDHRRDVGGTKEKHRKSQRRQGRKKQACGFLYFLHRCAYLHYFYFLLETTKSYQNVSERGFGLVVNA